MSTASASGTVSAVLIVKNEQAMLPRALASVAGVDEIVVCDTGSTDRTVEIATRFGARVVSFPWIDDFAAARNYAKQHATGDWVLSIDADEFVAPGGIETIRAQVTRTTASGLFVRMQDEHAGQWHALVRVFRRAYDWVGAVHESVAVPSVEAIDATIYYGHSPAHALDPDVDLRILERLEQPTPRDLYYLAREYFYRSRWDEAIGTLSRYFTLETWKPERADAYLMAARCYWQSQRGDEARNHCLQALNLNANFREAALFMAEISWPENGAVWRAMAAAANNRDVLFVRA
jgi:glycosyltransferase involved in cell wall biosynthesis